MVIRKSTMGVDSFNWIERDNSKMDSPFIAVFPNKNFECDVLSFKRFIFTLFGDNLKNILVGPPAFRTGSWDSLWGYFEFADIQYKYDLKFARMMLDDGIELDYSGYCEVLNWNRFLDLLLAIILNVDGAESLFFYNIKQDYCFYPHYTCSIGIYYNERNDSIIKISEKGKQMGGHIEYGENNSSLY